MKLVNRQAMGGIWMVLIDRKKLARLMVIQGVSQRELAQAAGWRSHSYLGKLLRGTAVTLEVKPAVRIAKYLGVGTDDLFMSRVSSDVAQTAHRRVAVAA